MTPTMSVSKDMLTTPLQQEAAEECLRRNIPFALYALPSDDKCRFIASLPDDDGKSQPSHTGSRDSFFISRFMADEPYMAGISDSLDEESIINLIASRPDIKGTPTQERPYLTSTRRVSYMQAFEGMTHRLRKEGGKVVLSRHESVFTTRSLLDSALDYFSSSPSTFRYLCFTPETGIWAGATPELLLETGTDPGLIRTMALAGTRPRGTQESAWDSKNLLEHNIVVNFISEILQSHSLKVDVGQLTEVSAGAVTHLCTPITASGDLSDIMSVINDLNPTPAVAGFPRDKAISEIDYFETHQRRCYSGIVGVRDSRGWHVYVNLRCAMAARATLNGNKGWIFNIYAGGGLMPDSRPDDEWDETDRKMSMLRASLQSASSVIETNPTEATFIH